MAETGNFCAPEPEVVVADESCFQPPAEPQLTYEECDLESLLWPFYNDTEPKTLEDIGFELNITPSIMHLFPPSSLSSHSVHKVADNGMEPLPNHQLQPPSRAEEISRMQERIEDGSGVTSAAAEDSFDVNQFLQEPTWMEERMGDGSGMTSGVVDNSSEEPSRTEERMGDGSGETSSGPAKKPTKRRVSDDDSWMPEGWVKKVSQRPQKGKFPGYVDKKYYAPGVARAFRSKVEALRYIESLKNAATSSNM